MQIRGIPCRIQFKESKLSDIGQVNYVDDNNEWRSRSFIINASLGITADANQLFNRGDLIIRTLKSRALDFTILYTALKTLLSHKNKEIRIKENGSWRDMKFANISITKSPYISGGFHYNRCPERDSGQFGFHCTGDMSRLEIIKTLMDLSKGIFRETGKKNTRFLSQLEISSKELLALETDGEIQLGRNFRFSTFPRAIKLAV
jgi:diacylglycerol kinase family enzyme